MTVLPTASAPSAAVLNSISGDRTWEVTADSSVRDSNPSIQVPRAVPPTGRSVRRLSNKNIDVLSGAPAPVTADAAPAAGPMGNSRSGPRVIVARAG